MTVAKFAIPSAILTVSGAVAPACAQDQRDALLEAALRRISALETKVGKIDALEQENRQLRSKLGKAPVRRETYVSASTASNQLVAISGPVDEVEPMTKTNRWEGFYAGINAGYGANNINKYTGATEVDKETGNILEGTASREASYIGGALAGGQFGYNHVFANHLMLGAEADVNWSNIYNNTTPNDTASHTLAVSFKDNIPKPFPTEINSKSQFGYSRVGLDWIGTVRARVGYDLGKFLPYVTGGLAYGGLSSNLGEYAYGWNQTFRINRVPVAAMEAVSSGTDGYTSTVTFGWALGAGAEFMVADGWSVKGEYLYTSIGGITMPQQSWQSETGAETKTYTSDHTGSFGVHQARVGLNYHPGWSFTEPMALFAKY